MISSINNLNTSANFDHSSSFYTEESINSSNDECTFSNKDIISRLRNEVRLISFEDKHVIEVVSVQLIFYN